MFNSNAHVHYTRFNPHSISDGPGFKIIVCAGSDSTEQWTPLHTHTHTHTHIASFPVLLMSTVFDCLQYAKWREKPGEFHHVIRGTTVMCPRATFQQPSDARDRLILHSVLATKMG